MGREEGARWESCKRSLIAKVEALLFLINTPLTKTNLIKRMENIVIMTKKQIIILGAGVMQEPAIRIAKDLGLETVVLDANAAAPCAALADRFENIDLKDRDGVLALARTLPALAGVMTAGTDFSATVAFAAERLGLPGVSYEAALNASDKGRMRECFRRAGVPSPRFVVLEASQDMDLPFSFPVVVKPVDNMGARGCRRVDGPAELREAMEEAFCYSRSGRIIIEEFMDGPEFSIDAVIYQGEITITGFADRHIFFPPYFIEMGHTIPTNLEEGGAAEMVEVFKRGVWALGLGNGAAKGDVKLTRRGVMIGEIAARLSGGYMSGWTYPYSSGVEPTRAAIQIAIGEKPTRLTPVRRWTSAERAFISIPGEVYSIIEKEPRPPCVKDVFFCVKEGGRVRFPESNVGKAGNVIATASSRESAVKGAETAARNILIRLSAPDEETEAFLGMGEAAGGRLSEGFVFQFPPDAFAVPTAILLSLEGMCESLENSGEGDYNMKKPYLSADVKRLQVGIRPFPEFTESGLLDYAGRTVAESLDAVRLLTGRSLPMTDAVAGGLVLGGVFWRALIRGGYQGAAYVVDRCGSVD
jgi:biotin carboxylase